MSASGRWFRVNTTWSQSEWLAALEPASRLAWIEMLGYVKAHGFDGKVRSVAPLVFGRMFGIPLAAVKALLSAAVADGALAVDDGHWVITGWSAHQGDPTGAQRVRRYRERREKEEGVTPVTRYDRVVTATETETETETTDTDTSASHSAAEPPDDPPAVEIGDRRERPLRLVPEEARDTERVPADKILAAWIDAQPERPPDPVVRKQSGAAKKLAAEFTKAELTLAWGGMKRLFPYAPPPLGKSEPWDLFTLRSKAGLAIQAAKGPADRSAQEQAEFQSAIQERKASGF